MHTLRTWRNADTPGRLPSEGDVVLVKEGPRRAKWPLAIVVRVILDEVVEVKLRGNATRRASKLLYPLEADTPWEQGAPLSSVPAATAASNFGELQVELSQPEGAVPVSDNQPAVPVHTSHSGRAVRMPARFLD